MLSVVPFDKLQAHMESIMMETGMCKNEAIHILNNLDEWAKPQPVSSWLWKCSSLLRVVQRVVFVDTQEKAEIFEVHDFPEQ